MKNVFLIVSFSFLLFMNGSCLKDSACNNKTVDSERSAILAYASANGITATEHSSGVFYQVITPGSGATPSTASTVTVRYIGKRLDGQIFDDHTSSDAVFRLGDVILGWQQGLPLIQEGGSIKLIIPSSLGYGCTGFGSVPSNTILYFEINLIDVN
ncbi:MAG: FKBP-type peptidyl-prolyl cis-trans isomerase [Bacteroidota bacterium]